MRYVDARRGQRPATAGGGTRPARCRGTRTRARPTTPGAGLLRRRPVARREVRAGQRATGCEASASGTCSWTAARRELWDQLWRNFGDLPFRDIDDSPFLEDIIWLAEAGHHHRLRQLTASARRPRSPAARWRASWPARSTCRAGDADHFTDDNGSVHEPTINRIAEAGITSGCGRGRFCPDAHRARARRWRASSPARWTCRRRASDYFTDDEGSAHESAINRWRAAGITDRLRVDTLLP